jgi:SIR2-like domain
MTAPFTIRPLLQMLDDLLREHESAPRGTQVLPCLTDDLAGDINIIAAAIHSSGGAILNTTRIRAENELPADAYDYRSPAEGKASSLAASAISGALRYRRAGAELGVRVVDVGRGRIDAAYVAVGRTSPVPLPTSSDALLALVRALSSARFERQEGKLAVVIYDEAELDAEQRRAAWGLSAHLKSLALGPRTLVMVAASAEIDTRRHVRYDTGFRYAHSKGEVVRRHPPETSRAMIADIVRASSGYIAMFLGAGFSASSGLALGNALRDEALQDMHLSPPGASSTELAAGWYRHIEEIGGLLDSEVPLMPEQRIAGLTLERVLREEYRTFSPEPPPTLVKFKTKCDAARTNVGVAPRRLAEIIRSGRKLVICTVNFDELIETAASGACEVFATDDDFERAPDHLTRYLAGSDPKVPLWKLHGTISNLESCVASDDQTLLGLSDHKRKALEALISSSDQMRPAPWMYIGASMRDSDLTPIWARPDFAAVVREYWVMPFSVNSVRDFVDMYRAEAWRQQRARTFEQRLVTETADTFLKVLVAAFTEASARQ